MYRAGRISTLNFQLASSEHIEAGSMAAERARIAVIGAGIGGLTVAACLLRLGFSVEVYEQASQFAPIGAGIQLTANAMKALGGLGLIECLRSIGFVPA